MARKSMNDEEWRELVTKMMLSDEHRHRLTPWELSFVANMHGWTFGMSDKQYACLNVS